MKKVFSKKKFIENEGYEEYQKSVEMCGIPAWQDRCDEKTKEECLGLDFVIDDDWCVEVEDDD